VGLITFLVLLALFTKIINPTYDLSSVQGLATSILPLALAAVAQTVCVIAGGIDLSIGSQMALTSCVAAVLMKGQSDELGVAIVIGVLLLGLVLGAVNGALVVVTKVPDIVVTLATSFVWAGFALLVTPRPAGGAAQWLKDLVVGPLGSEWIPKGFIVLVIVVGVIWIPLRRSRYGLALYAIGSNPDAARLSGIRSDRAVFGAFVVLGLLCGLAGVLWSARFAGANARTATGFELVVIAAVVVGGVNVFGGSGTVLGAALGALLLGAVQNGLLLLRVSSFWLQAVYGAVILIAVTLDALLTRRLERRRAPTRAGAT